MCDKMFFFSNGCDREEGSNGCNIQGKYTIFTQLVNNMYHQCTPVGFSQLFMISMYIGGVMWRPVLYFMMPDKCRGSSFLISYYYLIPTCQTHTRTCFMP